MDVTVRHGKRRRDSDVPAVPAQPASRATRANSSANPVPERPTETPHGDRKAVRLRDVELQAPAAPLTAPPRRQPDARDWTGMHDTAHASAPPLVSVEVNGQTKYAKARLADMDEGLVMARRTEAIDGLYSEDFASCRAVILTSATAVGLSHTSSVGPAFFAHVRACRAEFRQEAGEAEARLVIGASVALHRAGLEDEWDAHGGADFLESERMCFGDDHVAAIRKARAALPEPTEEALRRSDVHVALKARHRRLRDEAQRCGAAQLLRLPRGAVMVPLNGPIDLLDDPPPRAVSSGPLAAPHAGRRDLKAAPQPGRGDRTDRSDRPASSPGRGSASHQSAAPAAELAHDAIVTVSHAAEVLYPQARLVVDDGELAFRRAGECTGLLTTDVTCQFVLALIGPPSDILSLSNGDPQPTATALIRLDPRDDYQAQADRAVLEFQQAAGRPIQVRVGVATEDFEAHVESTMGHYSAEELLAEYGTAAVRPEELTGGALSRWLMEHILHAHNGRADELAARYRGEAIALPHNMVFLDPSGELDVFANEPDVTLAPSAEALAKAAAAQNDAALLAPVRRADDKGARPTRPSALEPRSLAVARDTRPASPAASAPVDDSEPLTRSGGSPAKPSQ